MITPVMKSIINQIVDTCPIYTMNNPSMSPQRPPDKIYQTRGTYFGKDWQMDFTVMKRVLGNFRYLLVLVDTFSGWIEAFPARTETVAEVAKALLKEIIPRFGLQGSLQSDNGPAFVSQVKKGITSALGRKWTLHSGWRHQSLGKVEQSNQT